VKKKKQQDGPKILLFDIETAPILAYVWRLWDENIGLNQIKEDWHVLSWAAKWLDDDKVMYADQRSSKKISDDKAILQQLWNLLNEADIVVTQNGKKFDEPKIKARMILHGMPPYSPVRHFDTWQVARNKFAFTSNKLEYLSKNLSTIKKLTRRKFDGFDLWAECLKGNKAAWREMERYNKIDVLALEQVYKKLAPWDTSINHTIYHTGDGHVCSCGSKDFKKDGFSYNNTGKFQAYVCKQCGTRMRGKENLVPKDKRKKLLAKIT
jgi:hypothetical protein